MEKIDYYKINKQKLIEALKSERLMFAKKQHSTTEHDIVIQYLESGSTKYNPDDYDLLDAAINDFDMLCSDYGC